MTGKKCEFWTEKYVVCFWRIEEKKKNLFKEMHNFKKAVENNGSVCSVESVQLSNLSS